MTPIKIILAGQSYDLPALPLNKGADMTVFMAGANPAAGGSFWDDAQYVQALNNIVFHSLRRQYPDIAPEVVTENIDFVNIDDVILAVRQANRLVDLAVGADGGDDSQKKTKSTGKNSSPTSPS